MELFDKWRLLHVQLIVLPNTCSRPEILMMPILFSVPSIPFRCIAAPSGCFLQRDFRTYRPPHHGNGYSFSISRALK